MRVIICLCAAFALSVTSAGPVTEATPEPPEEPASVQQNKTGAEKLRELLRDKTGRMSRWFDGGFSPTPYYDIGDNGCPSNWQRYGSRCFTFINSPMAWMDAEKHCWPNGANLASIHDPWEYNSIQSFMINSGYYGPIWIGGSDAVRSRDWLWSDGSEFNAESWATLKLNTLDRWKKCLTINLQEYQTLNNWFCENRLPFICGTRPPGQFEHIYYHC